MNTELTTESHGSDRFFVAAVDGRKTVFVLHADRSICIAPATQPVRFTEPAETILAELIGLAA